MNGCALRLFQSYLTGRSQCVSVEGVLSELSELAYGVPQGSVIGPIAFCMYTTPLGAILRHYKINYHICADDIQLYCFFKTNSLNEVFQRVTKCISDIRSWMIINKLKINDDKTEPVIISSPRAKFSTAIPLCTRDFTIISM